MYCHINAVRISRNDVSFPLGFSLVEYSGNNLCAYHHSFYANSDIVC